MSKKDPDWEKLTEVNDELDRLVEDGELTEEEWTKLLEQAREAVGGHTEYLEGFLMRSRMAGFVAK